MKFLDRLLHRPDPEEQKDKAEMAQLHEDFNHAAKRALKLHSELGKEIRRLEGAPWKR